VVRGAREGLRSQTQSDGAQLTSHHQGEVISSGCHARVKASTRGRPFRAPRQAALQSELTPRRFLRSLPVVWPVGRSIAGHPAQLCFDGLISIIGRFAPDVSGGTEASALGYKLPAFSHKAGRCLLELAHDIAKENRFLLFVAARVNSVVSYPGYGVAIRTHTAPTCGEC
jgi:hypothetical protein